VKLFKDRDCRVEAKDAVTFGEVEVGTSGSVSLWLKNDSQGLLRKIRVSCSDPDVAVKSPGVLKPGEVCEVLFTWTPPVELRKGLHADVTVEAEEVYE
jgi:hypothetical protein